MQLLQNSVLFCTLSVLTNGAHAQDGPFKFVKRAGVTLKARAYISPGMPVKYASRYDLEIVKTPNNGFQWDYSVEDEADNKYNRYRQLYGFTREKSYNNKKTATIRLTLRKYETYNEKLVFKSLDLLALNRPNNNGKKTPYYPTSRFLDLKTPRTLTTPSGISVTLLAKPGAMSADGNARAIFIAIKTSPTQLQVVLPKSPLYKKFGKPVSIQIESLAPNFMVSSFVDNTSDTLAVGFPDLYKVSRLDALTLVVRQRADLQAIPIAIELPVERPAKSRRFTS